jgi:hypothetical protein
MNELNTYERERVYSALTLIATRLFGERGKVGRGRGREGGRGEEERERHLDSVVQEYAKKGIFNKIVFVFLYILLRSVYIV